MHASCNLKRYYIPAYAMLLIYSMHGKTFSKAAKILLYALFCGCFMSDLEKFSQETNKLYWFWLIASFEQ